MHLAKIYPVIQQNVNRRIFIHKTVKKNSKALCMICGIIVQNCTQNKNVGSLSGIVYFPSKNI